MSDVKTVFAAGTIPFRRSESSLEVLIAHRPRYDDWSFPKGKRDEGETDYDCALRETEEETGAIVEPLGELTPVSYSLGRNKHKTVRFWYGRYVSGDFDPNDEVDEIKWVTVSEAEEVLSYDRDRELLQEFFTLVN